MDDDVLKITFAALIHDIGKFADEGVLDVKEAFIKDHTPMFQPSRSGEFFHRHAIYTAAFLDQFDDAIPRKFSQDGCGIKDSLIDLAAGHHKPETPSQWIIAMADRIAGGLKLDDFDEEYNHAPTWQEYRKTRLLPILERISPDESTDSCAEGDYNYRYLLREVSPSNLFPALRADATPSSDKGAVAEYRELFRKFSGAFKRLLHRDENPALWLEHLESLLMVFTSAIPSPRAGKMIPDIPLYDHSRITAALAAALYFYHRDKGTMNIDAIRDCSDSKFLIVSGDFFGIQKFIFSDRGVVRRHRAKILRGRSFAVSLLSELAADMLCREIGLPATAVVLNAAGRFTLIAPNTETAKRAITAVEERANDWLIQMTYGESTIGIVSQEAAAVELVEEGLFNLWDGLNQRMEKKKYQKFPLDKYGGTVKGFLDEFRNDLKKPLCPFCGKRPSAPEAEGTRYAGEAKSCCRICRDHIFLGTYLVKRDRFAVTVKDVKINADEKLLEPIFGIYQAAFLGGDLNDLARDGYLFKHWDVSVEAEGVVPKGMARKFINGYVPIYREEDLDDERFFKDETGDVQKEDLQEMVREEAPKIFDHIACGALTPKKNDAGWCGLAALGILKADVDDLGLIMSCGLKGKQFTFSRLATLSRQLNAFFSLFVPHLLKTDSRFRDVYTVFSGGDDLYLIGPWNRIIDLASHLRNAFADYVCRNAKVHFSAGITLQKPGVPLERIAEETERALDQSKRTPGKNSITLFAKTASWEKFIGLRDIGAKLQEWLDEGLINSAMLYRLNSFSDMAEMESRLLKSKADGISIDEMECLKWRAFFHYTKARNIGRGMKDIDRKSMMDEFEKAAIWLDQYGGSLRMALWNVIYNNR